MAQITPSPDAENKPIQLTWAYPVEGDYVIRLYRAANGGPLNTLQTLPNNIPASLQIKEYRCTGSMSMPLKRCLMMVRIVERLLVWSGSRGLYKGRDDRNIHKGHSIN
ncbi:MAG: hypothetical protein AAGG59_08175 [Bacteroidota bacterium]